MALIVLSTFFGGHRYKNMRNIEDIDKTKLGYLVTVGKYSSLDIGIPLSKSGLMCLHACFLRHDYKTVQFPVKLEHITKLSFVEKRKKNKYPYIMRS